MLQLEDMACQLMHGHTDIVLAVDVSNDFKLVSSASKDNTVHPLTLPRVLLSATFSSIQTR